MPHLSERASGTVGLRPGVAGSDDPSLELASRRTRLSFQRTRMSADRTLMSIVRTALALIGFGFTTFQFFRFLKDSAGIAEKAHAARNFGVTLIGIGIVLLVLGIAGHIRFMLELRADHDELVGTGLIRSDRFPYSATLAISVLVLALGLLAVISIVVPIGPFS